MSNVIEQLLLPSDIKGLHLTIAPIISNLFNNFYTICRGKQETKINPLGNRLKLKPFFCIGRLRENVHFWNCQCKSAHYIL